ncbi:MAG: DUF1343 domain-containing protein [Simkaniaceae bacterium]|nr:DUF1343 domain-containing protein [Simkaniaceae bacterium]MCF7852174.1 DUF1343 domain-containing protein [Simkaniaceae bacterium]
MRKYCPFLFLIWISVASAVQTGADLLLDHPVMKQLKNKNVGLITNQTGVNSNWQTTIELLSGSSQLNLVALFSPEHGISGQSHAWEFIADQKKDTMPIYSLHGATRRPTDAMLKGIDVLIYDIQDIGVRPYTYASTLFYAMEEAAKHHIKVIVLDRPNPMSGVLVDGPLLDEKNLRSFIGYINVPYCHGMTIGELATFFNEEYHLHSDLEVIKMRGWKRGMSFSETGLPWLPPSPNIPEPDTPYYTATTGALGELGIVNIGVGYTLPFKIVGAPWIKGKEFAEHLNKQKLAGVYFSPFVFKPYYGIYKGIDCEGVLIKILNHQVYRPLSVQMLLLGCLKSLYPKDMEIKIKGISKEKQELFCKAIGNQDAWNAFQKESIFAWKLIEQSQKESESFLTKRKKYLFTEYE